MMLVSNRMIKAIHKTNLKNETVIFPYENNDLPIVNARLYNIINCTNLREICVGNTWRSRYYSQVIYVA